LPVHRRQDVGIELIEARELFGTDPHGVGLKQQANPALTDEARDFLDDEIESRNGPERLQRRAVCGVLPRDGGDLRQCLPRTRRGKVVRWLSHAYLLSGSCKYGGVRCQVSGLTPDT